ncbi:MAG TPA: hypothetical protein ENI33_07315 [Thermoplasmatales archaeon]|nr:hypothetical protein [Thermoplasmatales archaeon]
MQIKKKGLVQDKKATFIPLRFVISVVMIAIIFSIFFLGFRYASRIIAEKNVDRECSELIGEISTMVASGNSRNLYDKNSLIGDTRTKKFNFPDELIYIGFGVDPDSNNDGILEEGLLCNGSCIVYKVNGFSKKYIWLDESIKFRKGVKKDGIWIIKEPPQGYILVGGGKIELTFELVNKNSEKYVLIY